MREREFSTRAPGCLRGDFAQNHRSAYIRAPLAFNQFYSGLRDDPRVLHAFERDTCKRPGLTEYDSNYR